MQTEPQSGKHENILKMNRESLRLCLWVGGFSDWNMKNGIEVCIWHNGMCFQRVEQSRAQYSTAEKSGLEQSTLLFS